MKHAATPHVKAIIISSEDMDMRMLCISFALAIPVSIFQQCVLQHHVRYIDISKIASALGEDVCKALLGLHAFTGCDGVNTYAGIGKVRPLKLLRSKKEFQVMFQTESRGTVVCYRGNVHPAGVIRVCHVWGEER